MLIIEILYDLIFPAKKGYKLTNSITFKRLIEVIKDSVIIDVRDRSEHLKKRIPRSINIDVFHTNYTNKLRSFKKDKTYFVYSGGNFRSIFFCKKLVSLGFQNIYALKGGIRSWTGAVITS